jgi:hypothetical protein
MNRTFELHFFRAKTGYELVGTKFASFEGQINRCVRGKTVGAFKGSGGFQWLSAVKGIAALNLRYLVFHSVPSISRRIRIAEAYPTADYVSPSGAGCSRPGDGIF